MHRGVVDNKSYDGKMVGLPKGICVNKLGLYLPIVTYLNNLIWQFIHKTL